MNLAVMSLVSLRSRMPLPNPLEQLDSEVSSRVRVHFTCPDRLLLDPIHLGGVQQGDRVAHDLRLTIAVVGLERQVGQERA